MRILVVDDSEDWRDLTEAALLAAGYEEIATAESAVDAYGQLGLAPRPHNNAPMVDLVVLDVVMPEIDGIEACARIRSDPRYTDVPVIMVTAVNDMDSLSSAFVAGATDYITKPFNSVELLARVRSALKIKADLDRRRARESELISLTRSTWGDRDAAHWVDSATGLPVGASAEAYLAAAAQYNESAVSVFALAIDRLEALAAARGAQTKTDALAHVARAISTIGAPIGVIPASYPDGTIVLVAPGLRAAAAKALGQAVRTTVQSLAMPNPEAITANCVTISVGLVTAFRGRTELVADARRLMKEAISGGGNRVAAVDLTSH
jgi:sigma-B regulation protein RsbU (phosphoserine phosphatase)